MAELFGVSPGELRVVSRRLVGVSLAMNGAVGRLREGLAEAGAAWGDDEFGRGFAEGEGGGGHVEQAEWVCDSVDAKKDLLNYYAEVLKRTADLSEGYD